MYSLGSEGDRRKGIEKGSGWSHIELKPAMNVKAEVLTPLEEVTNAAGVQQDATKNKQEHTSITHVSLYTINSHQTKRS